MQCRKGGAAGWRCAVCCAKHPKKGGCQLTAHSRRLRSASAVSAASLARMGSRHTKEGNTWQHCSTHHLSLDGLVVSMLQRLLPQPAGAGEAGASGCRQMARRHEAGALACKLCVDGHTYEAEWPAGMKAPVKGAHCSLVTSLSPALCPPCSDTRMCPQPLPGLLLLPWLCPTAWPDDSTASCASHFRV